MVSGWCWAQHYLVNIHFCWWIAWHIAFALNWVESFFTKLLHLDRFIWSWPKSLWFLHLSKHFHSIHPNFVKMISLLWRLIFTKCKCFYFILLCSVLMNSNAIPVSPHYTLHFNLYFIFLIWVTYSSRSHIVFAIQ